MVNLLPRGVSVNPKTRCLVREKPEDRARLDEQRKASVRQVALGISVPITNFEGLPPDDNPTPNNQMRPVKRPPQGQRMDEPAARLVAQDNQRQPSLVPQNQRSKEASRSGQSLGPAGIDGQRALPLAPQGGFPEEARRSRESRAQASNRSSRSSHQFQRDPQRPPSLVPQGHRANGAASHGSRGSQQAGGTPQRSLDARGNASSCHSSRISGPEAQRGHGLPNEQSRSRHSQESQRSRHSAQENTNDSRLRPEVHRPPQIPVEESRSPHRQRSDRSRPSARQFLREQHDRDAARASLQGRDFPRQIPSNTSSLEDPHHFGQEAGPDPDLEAGMPPSRESLTRSRQPGR